jgi:DNA-binding NarL/FixJ family response regulator
VRLDDRLHPEPPVALIAGPDVLRRVTAALEADGVDVNGNGRSFEDGGTRVGGSAPHAAVLVCDSSMQAREELQGLRQRSPDTKVVAIAAVPTAEDVRDALAEGADGVVLEDDIELCLALAVRLVCRGQVVVPSSLRQSVLKPSLSVREKQVLGMVVLGFTNGEIARKLFVTESTVKSHLSSSFKKLGVRSRTQATQAILDPEHGLGTGILAISPGAERDS